MEELLQSLQKNHMDFRMILASDTFGVIGHDNDLVFKGNREDMYHFRECTLGQAVLMGHKTFQSLESDPLINRLNIVLTHDPAAALREFAALNKHPYGRPDKMDNCFLQSYISDSTMVAFAHPRDVTHYMRMANKTTLWVIGGASIYEQLWDHCPVKMLTLYDCSVEKMIEDDTFRTEQGNRLELNKLVRIPRFQNKIYHGEESELCKMGEWKDGNGNTIQWRIHKIAPKQPVKKPLEPPMVIGREKPKKRNPVN